MTTQELEKKWAATNQLLSLIVANDKTETGLLIREIHNSLVSLVSEIQRLEIESAKKDAQIDQLKVLLGQQHAAIESAKRLNTMGVTELLSLGVFSLGDK